MVTILLPGCGSDNQPPEKAESDLTADHAGDGAPSITVFGGIVITITPSSDLVTSGGELLTNWQYVNVTTSPITIHDCALGLGASGIVERDDPDPLLWNRPTADCGGDYVIQPGERHAGAGPSFAAHTEYGVPLGPGRYDAVYETDGEAVRIPIEVVAATRGR